LREVKVALAEISPDTFGPNSDSNSDTEDDEETNPINGKGERN